MNNTPNAEVKRLLEWTPGCVPLQFEEAHNPYNTVGVPGRDDEILVSQGELDVDQTAPFFSEAYLYNLLGKEDARTLLALTRKAFKSLGVEVDL